MADPKSPRATDEGDTIDDSVDPDTEWSLMEPLPGQEVTPEADWSPFEAVATPVKPAPESIVDDTRRQNMVTDHNPETTELPLNWSEISILHVDRAGNWPMALRLQVTDNKDTLPHGIRIIYMNNSNTLSINRAQNVYEGKTEREKLRIAAKVNEFLKLIKSRNSALNLTLIKDPS